MVRNYAHLNRFPDVLFESGDLDFDAIHARQQVRQFIVARGIAHGGAAGVHFQMPGRYGGRRDYAARLVGNQA